MKSRDGSLNKRPLGVTIGPNFAPPPTAKVGSPFYGDQGAQIAKLTNAAQQYLTNGQSALAFDSLMEAYLIDPLDPRVISCEQAVLPAWEKYRTDGIAAVAKAPQRMSDEDRLARLKAERDAKRSAIERRMWDQASGTTRMSNPPGPSPLGKK
ncbi:hypothetical protein BAC2_02411 [uncultured bacterium]|nr:hypothetical protein BAC2_02411 [uncultured bacterium]